jgi:Putative peptidoglycan binding domain
MSARGRSTPSFSLLATFAAGAAILGGGGLACTHSHAVGDTQAETPADKSSGKAAKHEGASGVSRSRNEANESTRSHPRADAPPLATSPAGLLKPEAVTALQEKLVSRGRLAKSEESGKLDEPTHAALRTFQGENNLPATGMPDDLTVQKLGLRPDQVFRATPQGAGGSH